jgi:UTP--glucose-1-phosphate uridylyltransferase
MAAQRRSSAAAARQQLGGGTVVRTAVVPVAGLGTRFLPATKAVPKEMLPIVDRPAVQYIVEEAVRAGLDDVLLVTATGKSSIEDHFDRRIDLEVALEAKGRTDDLRMVRELASLATIHAVRQPEPLGLGHAVLMAAGHVAADESFAVLLGDDLLEPTSTFLARMVAAHERTGRAVVALMRVEDPDALAQYGVAAVADGDVDGELRITDLVEKPAPGTAPSQYAVIGRYVLPGAIFDVLRHTVPGRGGEIQLTDALRTLALDEPIVGLALDEPRHDAGDRLGFLTATLAFAALRPDLGAPLVAWLREHLDDLDARAAAAQGGPA